MTGTAATCLPCHRPSVQNKVDALEKRMLVHCMLQSLTPWALHEYTYLVTVEYMTAFAK